MPCKEARLVLFFRFSLNGAEGYVIQHEQRPGSQRPTTTYQMFLHPFHIEFFVSTRKLIINTKHSVFKRNSIKVQWLSSYSCTVFY